MKEMNRSGFIKTIAVGGAVLGLGNIIFHKPLEALASGKYDIGLCKSVRIKCVSELGWHDGRKLIKAIMSGGGAKANQWVVPWDLENAAGSCSLIDMETLEGLTAIPGIGPKLAGAIVREKAERDGFQRPDEILSVRGIGPTLYGKIRPNLVL